jgi:hypothetical protein
MTRLPEIWDRQRFILGTQEMILWCCDVCDAVQAMLLPVAQQLCQSGEAVVCIYGHDQVFKPGPSEKERLREKLTAEHEARVDAEEQLAVFAARAEEQLAVFEASTVSLTEQVKELQAKNLYLRGLLDTHQRLAADMTVQQAHDYRSQAARLARSAQLGVCPCCQHRFAALARHMADYHPDFIPVANGAEQGAPA